MQEESNPQVVKDGSSITITCAHELCKQQIQLQVPQIETVNQRSFSSYHFAHENLQQCPFCGQAYLFQLLPIGKGGMSFMFRPVQVKAENRIMTVDGNADIDKMLKRSN